MGLLAAAAGISVHETELLVSFTPVELVAILMTLMELVVINVGYDLGVIPPNVFAMLVLMAIFSTVITAPVLRIGLRKLGWKYELRPDVRSPCPRDPFAIGARCAKNRPHEKIVRLCTFDRRIRALFRAIGTEQRDACRISFRTTACWREAGEALRQSSFRSSFH